jgi:hypothetical protein
MRFTSLKSRSKADQIHDLLSMCAFFAVLYMVFELASHRYWKAAGAALAFLLVIPWLGKRWINRTR